MCHPPDSVDTYVHRSGRTGRAGKSGTCVVLYTPREASELSVIERRTGLVSRVRVCLVSRVWSDVCVCVLGLTLQLFPLH